MFKQIKLLIGLLYSLTTVIGTPLKYYFAECTLRPTDDESVESGYIKFKQYHVDSGVNPVEMTATFRGFDPDEELDIVAMSEPRFNEFGDLISWGRMRPIGLYGASPNRIVTIRKQYLEEWSL